jgi:hypothetical protein
MPGVTRATNGRIAQLKQAIVAKFRTGCECPADVLQALRVEEPRAKIELPAWADGEVVNASVAVPHLAKHQAIRDYIELNRLIRDVPTVNVLA